MDNIVKNKKQTLLDIVNGDLTFTTKSYKILENNQQKQRNIKITPLHCDGYSTHWYEAFALYYDKGGMGSRSDQSFSIELCIEENDKPRVRIGKKQTFMIYQFKNGKIIEKEIYFMNDN